MKIFLLVLLVAVSQARCQDFFANRANRVLTGVDLGVRLTDGLVTYEGLNHCPTCRERTLPPALAKSPGMIFFSVGVSVGVDFWASELWKHQHHKLARAALVIDSSEDGYAVIHDFTALR
jgi:hypothetical protein